MIPYGRQFIDEEDIQGVIEVLRSDWLTQGPKVIEFEKNVADYSGAKYAVAANNGTAALHLAYLASGLKEGDEVIITPNTFAATANMLLAAGVKPIFCDIRLDTYNIDENKIESLITAKTKAIVPVDFAGHPCEMDKISAIAKKYNLIVIEDACHALGARYKDRKIGNTGSDMAVFSFHPVKPITTGEGGMVVTNNKEYFEKLILFRNHGIYKDEKGKNVMVSLGYNYRLSDMGAALGLSQLKKIDRFIEKRRQIIDWYEEELKGVKGIILPKELADNFSGWHLYVIRIAKSELRGEFSDYLKKNGISVNFHYPAVYSHPYYQNIGYGGLKLENEEIYQKSCLTLPCYFQLTRDQVEFIGRTIKDFFTAKNNL